MKQKIKFIINDVFKGFFESTDIYVNNLSEDLKVFNITCATIFSHIDIYDAFDNKLSYDTIPLEKNKFFHMLINFVTPVPPKNQFSLKTHATLEKLYFEITTIQKDDIFFWHINHVPGIYSELDFEIEFSDKFKFIHAIGIQPKIQNEMHISWHVNLNEKDNFNPIVVYRLS
ncbi:MAG: hypothetical protein ACD_79C00693G0005 [uncultured bacterium]|nr:MAG: hypothetical protein ACD_79C00693G0005 [uncultured bacterium]